MAHGLAACDAPKHCAIQQRIPSKTVCSVHPAGDLSCGKKSRNWHSSRVQNLGMFVDAEATHRVMHNRRDLHRVHGLLKVDSAVREHRLAKLICGAVLHGRVVVSQLGAQRIRIQPHGHRNLIHAITLDCQTSLSCVKTKGGCPEVIRLRGAQQQPGGFTFLPQHLARDVVPPPELVDKALASRVQEDAAHPPEPFRRKELCVSIWIFGVNQTCGVHLHLIHVHELPANSVPHADAIPCSPLAVCRSKAVHGGIVGAEHVPVGAKSTGGHDDDVCAHRSRRSVCIASATS
mmetsp:Transcript_24953/g.62797  ORF Transcript_24953/g.62797 Transcript_24953/m.62797 type:complete len:290 (+) Transcript_24953:270-1139(+)